MKQKREQQVVFPTLADNFHYSDYLKKLCSILQHYPPFVLLDDLANVFHSAHYSQ